MGIERFGFYRPTPHHGRGEFEKFTAGVVASPNAFRNIKRRTDPCTLN